MTETQFKEILKKLDNIFRPVQVGSNENEWLAVGKLVDDDGTMARRPKLEKISEEYNLPLITIADLIEFRRKHEKLVEELSNIPLPNKFGNFRLRLFEDKVHGDHHVALVKGVFSNDDEVLVRVHSQCLTGDIFGSLRCDCGQQLNSALDQIEKEERGLLVIIAGIVVIGFSAAFTVRKPRGF